MEKIYVKMTRIVADNPENFRPEFNPAVCQAMVEAWKKEWLKNRTQNGASGSGTSMNGGSQTTSSYNQCS